MSEAIVSGWHNISGGTPSIKVDGILYQDIVSILESIKNDPKMVSYQEAVDIILNHTVNTKNPHVYSAEMLAEQVAITFYEKWLSEGYNGTIEEFYELLFRYIEYATEEDMTKGTDENKVPSVKLFHDTLTKHNEEVSEDIHSYVFRKFRLEAPIENMPQISLHQFLGIPRIFINNENVETKVYENVNTGFLSDKLSISLHGSYYSGTWIKIATNRNNTNASYFGVDVDTNSQIVKFYYRKSATLYIQQTISLAPLLEEINNSPEHLTIVMTIDKNIITGHVQLSSTYQELPIYSTIANIDEHNSIIVDTEIVHHDCVVTIPRMLPGDFLEDVTIYNKVLNTDGINYIFDLFN